MARHVLVFLLVCQLLHGCISEGSKQQYKYLGEVSFRRTYAVSDNVSDAVMDSIGKSNPTFMNPASKEQVAMLSVLTKFQMADKSKLLLDRISQNLKDTIYFAGNSSQTDTVYIQYSNNKEIGTAAIKIKNRAFIDSFPIKDEVFSHTFSLLKLNDTSGKLFAFIDQYYIMNGDNYEVSIYEKR